MSTSRAPAHLSRPRSGFSVIEVLVALMVVTVGLLGIAGSTALTVRTTFDAVRRHAAAERAESRIAQLTAGGCDRAVSASAVDTALQVTERWVVGARVNGFVPVTDTVRWTSARGPRTFSFSSALTC